MTGEQLANEVLIRFDTRDVREIASRAGISVRSGNWHPVTAGELDACKMEIIINQRADLDADTIIAHEVGHYFLMVHGECGSDAERICDEFAASILER